MPPSTHGTPPHNSPHDFGPDPHARQDFALAMSLTLFDDDPGDHEAFLDQIDTYLAAPELAAEALAIVLVVLVELARELNPRSPFTEIRLAWATRAKDASRNLLYLAALEGHALRPHSREAPSPPSRDTQLARRRRGRPGELERDLLRHAGAPWAAEADLVDNLDRLLSVATTRVPWWLGPADLGRPGGWV